MLERLNNSSSNETDWSPELVQRQPYEFEKMLAERRPASSIEEAITRGAESLAADLKEIRKRPGKTSKMIG